MALCSGRPLEEYPGAQSARLQITPPSYPTTAQQTRSSSRLGVKIPRVLRSCEVRKKAPKGITALMVAALGLWDKVWWLLLVEPGGEGLVVGLCQQADLTCLGTDRQEELEGCCSRFILSLTSSRGH